MTPGDNGQNPGDNAPGTVVPGNPAGEGREGSAEVGAPPAAAAIVVPDTVQSKDLVVPNGITPLAAGLVILAAAVAKMGEDLRARLSDDFTRSSILPADFSWTDTIKTRFAAIASQFAAALDSLLFPNWRGAELGGWDLLVQVTRDEGIALGWVPSPEVLDEILAAPDPAARRRVVSRRSTTILGDCELALQSVSHKTLAPARALAEAACKALRDGHHQAAQSLSACILTAQLHRIGSPDLHLAITKRKGAGDDFEEYPLREAFVYLGLCGAHEEFWGDRPSSVPKTFSRHATVHSTATRQYTRTNSIIALMHVTALLRLQEEQESRRGDR